MLYLMIDLTTAFAVSISEGGARLSIFVAEHICQSVLRHRVGKLTEGLRVGRSSNIVPKPYESYGIEYCARVKTGPKI